ncbi:MAG: GNAT family N-acetyltransferase [Hamadaea sp.]|nr:GNAT family N-acetyltransferase [Hamadaea sp.]NUR48397.1 GNAT family N-acetyltransferase [Hamadaea sp.]NUT06273.1 GNAT family N-acetyltransferase [Hamadaea sp.]
MTIDVALREPTPADAEQFHAFAAHPLVLPTVDAAQVPSVEDVRTFLTQLAAQPNSPRKERAIVVGGVVVGSIGLTIEGSEGELGYVVHPDHWGRGVATQAAMLMVHHGFAELGLTRIYAKFSRENPASVRVIQKAGFHQVDETTWEITR